MTKIKLKCEVCNEEFERNLAEANRNKKAGRAIYCSRSCAGKSLLNNIPIEKRYNVKYLNKGYDRTDEYSPFRYFLRKAKARDSVKNRDTNLTLHFLKDLWDKQEGKCAYSKLPMTKRKGNCKDPLQASLDRIDSSQGYIIGNVQFVCCIINLAKCDFSDKQVKEFIESLRRN